MAIFLRGRESGRSLKGAWACHPRPHPLQDREGLASTGAPLVLETFSFMGRRYWMPRGEFLEDLGAVLFGMSKGTEEASTTQ